MIGPAGEFGIHADSWAPLHASIEGWIEAVALTHHSPMCAKQITKITGDDVDGIEVLPLRNR